jgi:sugar phosphate isomerase/epimerase
VAARAAGWPVILRSAGGPHLTYCTNIHPGESWAEVRRNVERLVCAVKARIAPAERFGVGLRLSAAAARELADPRELDAFRALLDARGLYVFTVNGFPYGPFHGTPVKERVYLPDWMDDERLAYTDGLAHLLAALLPPGVDGTISTVPGAFRPRVASAADVARMVDRLVAHAATLHAIHARTGRAIALALEPEPCCFLETIAETVAFFEQRVFAAPAVERFRRLSGLGAADAVAALRRHLGVCLDTCHAAVEFEEPAAAVRALRAAGIRIAKVQLSAGLRLRRPDAEARAALARFDDPVYLHQVVARDDGRLTRWLDLPDAIGMDAVAGGEWRVHFHVPVFMERLGAFENTQAVLAEFLALQAADPISAHLEVETYTWSVLPEEHRTDDVVTAVARELRWVIERLGA